MSHEIPWINRGDEVDTGFQTRIEDSVNTLSRKLALAIESHVQLYISPKPRWLPRFAWTFFLKSVFRLKMTPPVLTVKELEGPQ